jgi:bifunctional DNA-binding transcriptional regulator/antitoxin component of YhaV-PrlF toxin-antitoxin module
MMNKKPIYKLMDGKGRVLIPKELRTASGMDYGDIVRLELANGRVCVQKVDIIEIGDQSPEAVETYHYTLSLHQPSSQARMPTIQCANKNSSHQVR